MMAISVFEIPLNPNSQRLKVSLAGVEYRLTLVFNGPLDAWVLDIADTADVPIAQGLVLVTGVDLLGQLAYLGLGGALQALTDSAPDQPPTYADLGSSGHLYFSTGTA